MQKTNKLVLQVGESTHTHVMESKLGIEHQGIGEVDDNSLHIVLEGEGILSHEEHGPMVFKKGNFFKFPQVEYSPFDGDIRQVFD